MNELHLFAGAGGGILAGQLLGHTTVCAVEWDPYAQAVLVARQNDGTFPPFPIWDDVQTFDGKPWRGIVDIVAGGFPCQDISVAGAGAGIDGKRSGMWHHMARIIGEVRPRFAFVENSPALLTRGLGVVLSDLAALGYDCRWTVLGAADVGAPHRRERFWLVANAVGIGSGCEIDRGEADREQTDRPASGFSGSGCGGGTGDVAHAASAGLSQRGCTGQPASRQKTCSGLEPEFERCGSVAHPYRVRELQPQGGQCNQRGRACDCGKDVHNSMCGRYRTQNGEVCAGRHGIEHAGRWTTEPELGRVANGVANRTHRLKAIGNGQVPLCAASAWRMLIKGV